MNQRNAATIPNHVHGTVNGYSNYGCRCDPCRTVKTDYDRERRDAVADCNHRYRRIGDTTPDNTRFTYRAECIHCGLDGGPVDPPTLAQLHRQLQEVHA